MLGRDTCCRRPRVQRPCRSTSHKKDSVTTQGASHSGQENSGECRFLWLAVHGSGSITFRFRGTATSSGSGSDATGELPLLILCHLQHPARYGVQAALLPQRRQKSPGRTPALATAPLRSRVFRQPNAGIPAPSTHPTQSALTSPSLLPAQLSNNLSLPGGALAGLLFGGVLGNPR